MSRFTASSWHPGLKSGAATEPMQNPTKARPGGRALRAKDVDDTKVGQSNESPPSWADFE